MNPKKHIVVLGGGIAGLSAAYFLSRSGRFAVTLLEKESVVGGMCASFEHRGFVLDYGAHKIYSVIPGVMEEIGALMSGRLLELPKKNRIFLKGQLLDYPLRFGNLLKALGFGAFLKLGFGYLFSIARGCFFKKNVCSYADYMAGVFGKPAYELIFEPLADKVWGDPVSLHWEMARTRIPSSSGLEVALKLLGMKKETEQTSAPSFLYPARGFGDLCLRLQEEIVAAGGQVITEVSVQSVRMEGRSLRAVEAEVRGQLKVFPSDAVVSAIPLPALGALLGKAGFPDVTESIQALQFRHVVLVYVFIKRPLVLKDQWIFFPEREILFSRIFEQKHMNPALGPAGETVLCCDFTCQEDDKIWEAGDAEIAGRCVDDLAKTGFIEEQEVTGFLVKRFRNFYPRYDLHYQEKLAVVFNGIKAHTDNLVLTGREGMYNYNNADHCFDMGRFIAGQMEAAVPVERILENLNQRLLDYRIVD